MNCKFCGARLDEGGTVCPDCKREQREPYSDSGSLPSRLSASRFWRERYFHKLPVILSGILCLISAALAFYTGYKAPTIRLLCLIDVALILGCAFFIALFRSRIFAVILAAYAVTITVMTFINASGMPPLPEMGLRALILAAAALGLCGTFRFRARFMRYKREYRLRSSKER